MFMIKSLLIVVSYGCETWRQPNGIYKENRGNRQGCDDVKGKKN